MNNIPLNIRTSNIAIITDSLQYKLERISHFSLISIAFFLPISTGITNALFLLTAILILLTNSYKKILSVLFQNRTALYFIGFWLMFSIGLLYTDASWPEALNRWQKHDKFLMAALFIVLFQNQNLARTSLKVFLLSMILTILISIFKLLGFVKINVELGGAASVFKSHIHTNFLMAYSAYVFLLFYYFKPNNKWLYFLLFLISLIYVVVLSSGRTGYIIILSLLYLYIYYCVPKRLVVLFFSILTFFPISLFYISQTFHNRILDAWYNIKKYQSHEDEYTSIGVRLNHVKNGLVIIFKNPIFGTGTGSVSNRYNMQESNPKFRTNNPHNEYINIAIQLGLLGLFITVMMFKRQFQDSDELKKEQALMAKGLILALMIGCLGNSLLQDTTESHFYVYMAALLFSRLKQETWVIKLSREIQKICSEHS